MFKCGQLYWRQKVILVVFRDIFSKLKLFQLRPLQPGLTDREKQEVTMRKASIADKVERYSDESGSDSDDERGEGGKTETDAGEEVSMFYIVFYIVLIYIYFFLILLSL